MIRLSACLLTLMLPAAAAAQSIRVESGEHADFSRLVLFFAETPDWEFGRVSGGYEFRVADGAPSYALGDIFELIPRDRIAAAENRAGRLFLSVDCSCHADAFEIRQGVVLDIKDGPPPRSTRFEQELDPAEREVATGQPSAPRIALPLEYWPQRTDLAWSDELSVPLATAKPPQTDDTPLASARPETAARVNEARSALVEQISRAAAQGLIEADIPDVTETVQRIEDLVGESEPSPEPQRASVEAALAAQPNVHVETAMDRAQDDVVTREPMTAEGGACLPSDRLAVHSWGTPPPDAGGQVPNRSGLIGEFDEADPKALAALARNLIYLTFGAETQALLAAFPQEIPDKDLLLSLAQIMDDGALDDPGPLRDQLGCDTAAALWAAFATPELTAGAPLARGAILEAFALLPLHLRRHLGPPLANRFRGIGDAETAATIRNSITRAPGDHGPGLDLLEAEIALDAGQVADGDAQLQELVAEDGPLAPDALIRLIGSRLDKGLAVEPSLRDAAGALAFEYRGTPEGAALYELELRAAAHADLFTFALDQLAEGKERGFLGEDRIVPLNREIFALIAAKAAPSEFLTLVLPQSPRLGTGPKAVAVERAIAARFLDLGLPAAARDILTKEDRVPEPEDRVLLAETHLSEGRADLAIGYLAGIASEEALRLKARAHAALADTVRSARLYDELGDTEALARLAWRGQDWPTVQEIGAPDQKRTADLLQTLEQPDPNAPPTLAGSRAVLDQSAKARAALATLLEGDS